MDACAFYKALREAYDIGLIESAPRSYSGRAMYGSDCIGITLSDSNEIFKLGVELGRILENGTMFPDLGEVHLPRMQTDSMGLGIIVYWPGMKWDPEYMVEDML